MDRTKAHEQLDYARDAINPYAFARASALLLGHLAECALAEGTAWRHTERPRAEEDAQDWKTAHQILLRAVGELNKLRAERAIRNGRSGTGCSRHVDIPVGMGDTPGREEPVMAIKIRSKQLELHVGTSPEFTRVFGARVKAQGGSYSHARGYGEKRFVKLPLNARGLALAEAILVADRADYGDALDPRWAQLRSKRQVVLVRWDVLDRSLVVSQPLLPQVQFAAKRRVAQVRVARQERRAAHQAAIARRRELDTQAVNEISLEAGERLAAEWLHNQLKEVPSNG